LHEYRDTRQRELTATATKALAVMASKALDLAAPGIKPIAQEAGGIIANALGFDIGDSLAHRRARSRGGHAVNSAS
jgi:hypothetical protein